jgi:two-component system response regulator PilR (NtrC family)
MNVLVVDDDEDTAVLLSLLLEHEGWRVDAASSVADAHRALDRDAYDVLVTDLHLPDGSGMSLLSGPLRYPLRAAIVVTGVDDEEQRAACMRLGFGRCLTKPLSGSELVASIRSLLAKNTG